MEKFRISIQQFIEGKPKVFANVVLLSDKPIEKIKQDIKNTFKRDYNRWERQFIAYLENAEYKKKIKYIINSDEFDNHAVGEDISDEEFIENEIYFATQDK